MDSNHLPNRCRSDNEPTKPQPTACNVRVMVNAVTKTETKITREKMLVIQPGNEIVAHEEYAKDKKVK